MFARVKKSREEEYLQIIETYRDSGEVRQRVVMYVDHYARVGAALERMPKELRYLRGKATKFEKHAATLASTLKRRSFPGEEQTTSPQSSTPCAA